MDDQQRARDSYMKYVDSSCGLGPNGDCHLWNGHQDARGYGKLGRKLATHIALELSGSQRPSTAHGALHSCDNPNCVNPSHLRWGTQKENAADASSRLRYPNVWKTHCPKGHEYTEENTILTQRREGWKDRKCRICANLRSKRRRAKHKEQRLSAQRAAPEWQPIETAPEGRLVVVGWLDAEDSHYPENYEFDYLEGGLWAKHEDCVEHAHAVAPPGSKMPKEQPPYQWWMDLPAFHAARPQGFVMVRKEAIDWLNGETEEGFECPPDRYFRGEPPRYWWRSVFREKAGLTAARPQGVK